MARVSPMMMAPPLVFVASAVLSYVGMQQESADGLPTAHAGKTAGPVPNEGLPRRVVLTDADLRTGEMTIVNVPGQVGARPSGPRILRFRR